MHIVTLSDLDIQGGAAATANRLADALCRVGHHVTRIVAYRGDTAHPWVTKELSPSLLGWAMRRILPRKAWRRFNELVRVRQLDVLLKELQPDIVDVHNLHSGAMVGWSSELVRACANHAPTVWTLHDMWSFTGRCTYSYECHKFMTGCDATCPTPTEYPTLEPDFIAQAWEQRRRLFADVARLVAVTPSRWMRQEAQMGLWRDHRVEVIPHGVPLDVYRPIERTLARSQLRLPVDGPILITAAQNLTERRKGGDLLVEALRRLAQRPITLATLGSGQIEMNDSGIDVHSFGYVEEEEKKVLVYNAADIYVHPAPVDNFPNTVREAIACGIPVVAFPIGGVPEMVRPDITGWLASELSSTALAHAMQNAFNDLARGTNLCMSCRAVAEAEYSIELQVQRYLALYESLLKST